MLTSEDDKQIDHVYSINDLDILEEHFKLSNMLERVPSELRATHNRGYVADELRTRHNYAPDAKTQERLNIANEFPRLGKPKTRNIDALLRKYDKAPPPPKGDKCKSCATDDYLRGPAWPNIYMLYNANTFEDYTSADACVVTCAEDIPEKQAYCITTEHQVIHPGESRFLPVTLVGHIENIEDSTRLLLIPDSFSKHAGNTISVLATPRIIAEHGLEFTNCTESAISIPRSTILAYVDINENDAVYGIADLVRYQTFMEKGRIDPPRGARLDPVLPVCVHAIKRQIEQQDLAKAKALLKKTRESEYGHALNEDDENLLHRLLLVDSKISLDKGNFTPEQQEEVKLILLAYSDCISLGIDDLPLADFPPLKIKLDTNKPLRIKCRPTPMLAREAIFEEIDQLAAAGIITKVFDSPYAFPLVIVPKPDLKFRACVDYRLLNSHTEIIQAPIPRLNEMINSIIGMHYLSAVDLSKAYHQMPVAEEDKKKTTFIYEGGTYAYNRIPFGLASAPAHFQSLINNEMKKIEHPKDEHNRPLSTVINYMDDIVIGGNTFDHYRKAAIAFLETLRRINMKYSLKKSEWARSEIRYLGAIITGSTWQHDPDRIKALAERPPPSNLKELRGCIAALSFYSSHLPNIQNTIEPLLLRLRNLDAKHRKKTRKPIPISLEQTAIDAWTEATNLLKSKIMLWHIDPYKPFYIFSDASDYASGSVLLQEKDNEMRPVAFHSRVFTKPERNYTTTEREFLAILHALEKYKNMLIGNPEIFIYTDHRSLLPLMKAQSETTKRLARWRIRLSQFNIKLRFIEGKRHGAADLLSRPPAEVMDKYKEYIDTAIDDWDTPMNDIPLVCTITVEDKSTIPVKIEDKPTMEMMLEIYHPQLYEYQKSDQDCQNIDQLLRNIVFQEQRLSEIEQPSALMLFAKKCLYIDSLLVAWSETNEDIYVPVIPRVMRKSLIEQAHIGQKGHLRGQRLLELIAARANWPNMKRDIRKFLDQCNECNTFLAGNTIQPMPGRFIANAPLDQVTIDAFMLGHDNGKQVWVLAAIDTCSRFAWAAALQSQAAEHQINALMSTVCQTGFPKQLIADHHPAYDSRVFATWAVHQGIRVDLSPGYSTKHVALVNRLHRTLREMILKSMTATDSMQALLPYVLCAYNSTIHPATGFAPAEIITGQLPYTKIDEMIGARVKPMASDKNDPITDIIIRRQTILKMIKERALKLQHDAVNRFKNLRSSRKDHEVKPGDRVFLRDRTTAGQQGKYAINRFFGPYVVTSIAPDGVHAGIEKEEVANAAPETAKIEDLTLAKDRAIIPIYPAKDLLITNRDPAHAEKIFIDEDYQKSNPNHPYNTRHKRKPAERLL